MRTGVILGSIAGCLLVAALAAGDPAEKPDAARVERLIRQLGDDDFSRREAASEELERIGEPARDALRKAAADSKDVELQRRAEAILRVFARRELEKHREKLQGAWSLVSYEQDGRPVKGEDRTHLFTFKGDRWSLTVGGTLFQGGTVTAIEKTDKHHTIDLLISEGSNPGATAYSIYTIEGDTLRYLNTGRPYATDFVTKPGDGRHYLTFRRVKK